MGKTKRTPRQNFFSLKVFVIHTQETFTVNYVHQQLKISELKKLVELSTGIPVQVQRLQYLDQRDLLDDNEIKKYDVVPKATINLRVWTEWVKVVSAAAENHVEELFSLGVTPDSPYNSPVSERLNETDRAIWLQKRGYVALFIASHRGYHHIIQRLIQSGIDINDSGSSGRTALHMAAANNQGDIIDILLYSGANLELTDCDGLNPLQLATKYGHKNCERRLFSFKWQQRAKNVKKIEEVPRFAHQYWDSTLPVWKEASYGRLYMQNILPPGEFVGGSLDAPRHKDILPPYSPESLKRREKEDHNKQPLPLTFAEWVANLNFVETVERDRRLNEKEKDKMEKELTDAAKERACKTAFLEWLARKEDEAAYLAEMKAKKKKETEIKQDKSKDTKRKTENVETMTQQGSVISPRGTSPQITGMRPIAPSLARKRLLAKQEIDKRPEIPSFLTNTTLDDFLHEDKASGDWYLKPIWINNEGILTVDNELPREK